MNLVVTCKCGKRLKVTAQHLGRKVQCKHCQRTMLVPDSPAPSEPAPQKTETLPRAVSVTSQQLAESHARTYDETKQTSKAAGASSSSESSQDRSPRPFAESLTVASRELGRLVAPGLEQLKPATKRTVRQARQVTKVAGLYAFKEVARAVAFYWSLRLRIAGQMAENVPTLGALSRRRREIRLPADNHGMETQWKISLPECCVVCGATNDLESKCEVTDVGALLRSTLPPAIATFLAIVVAYFWSGWAAPVLIALGFAVGYYIRDEQRFTILAWRCNEHAHVRRLPKIRLADGVAIIEVGEPEVKKLFIAESKDPQKKTPDFSWPHDLPDPGSSGDGAPPALPEGAAPLEPGASDPSPSVLTRSSDSGPLDSPPSRKSDLSTPRQSGAATIVRSPFLWVGLAGAVIVVGLIVALVVSLLESDQPGGGRLAAASFTPPGTTSNSTPSPEEAAPSNSSAPSAADLASRKPPAASAPTAPGPEGEDPAAPPDTSPAPGAAGAAPPLVQRPVQQPRTVPASPASPSSETQAVQRPPAASPPAVVESTADRQKRLLAEAEYFSLEFVSVDRDPRSKLNVMVRLLATQALERAGLKPTCGEPDPAVMRVAIETGDAGGLIGILVSAQLTCRDPAAGIEEESRVIVWERREQLATVTPRVLSRGAIHTMMRPGVGEFFRGFSDQCRAARQKR